MILYLIRNLVNNKCYVGQTREKYEGQRKRQHFYCLRTCTHQNPYLQSAFNKYGPENFQFEVIEVVESLERLNQLEKMWIDFYKSLDRSYNLRGGGDKNLVSEETKRRMKIAQNTPELLSLRSKTHKGLEKSKEHKRKISEGNTKTKGKFILVVNRLTGEIFEVFGSRVGGGGRQLADGGERPRP